MRSMWKYQWLKTPTPLTNELKDMLYEESQGILDIAVKLYAMAQGKAIADGVETITARTIREVAAEKLQLVKPMLKALKDGDIKKLAQYEDIRLLGVEDYLAAQYARLPGAAAETPNVESRSIEEQIVTQLLEMNVPSKVARSAVKKAIKQSVTGQPLSVVANRAMRIALNMENNDESAVPVDQANDLRNGTLNEVTASADEF